MAQRMADGATREQLVQFCQRGVWRCDAGWQTQPSGFAVLDAQLPGGGWPIGAITELMPELAGIGELRLLAPALVALARAGRYIAWIAPPLLPYAPALAGAGLPLERVLIIQTRDLKESLWAMEQTLRCPLFGAVLAWPASIADRNVRRLQLAAEAGGSLGILYRPPPAAQALSPAALRLRLSPLRSPLLDGLAVEIPKMRGGRAGLQLQLSLAAGNPRRASVAGGTDDALALHTSAAALP
jgi:cell division inhibitor SulA/protein ImuA